MDRVESEALRRLDPGLAERVALERLLGSLIAQGLGQPADAVPLEAAVQG